MLIVTLLASALALVSVGWTLERPRDATSLEPGSAFALGGAAATLPLLALARVWPVSAPTLGAVAWTITLISVAGLALRIYRLHVAVAPRIEAWRRSSWIDRAAGVAAVIAFGLFVWKISAVTVWSWDHFAIWGVKARQLAAHGLTLDFLAGPQIHSLRVDHPLGLPLLWALLSAGHVPQAASFKLAHVLMGGLLAVCFRDLACRLGAAGWAASLLTAVLCLSPLYYDTESLGLAEMPLALWSCAALSWAMRSPSGRQALACGLTLGFLPWLKQEGLPLALLLLCVIGALLREPSRPRQRHDFIRIAASALVLCAAAVAYQRWVLPPEDGFLSGNLGERLIQRVGAVPELLRLALDELLAWDWLGFWVALGAGTGWAIWRRSRTARALAAAVWIQSALYLAACYASWAPTAAEQLHAAFFRTCAALVPLGLLALAALGGDRKAR